MNELAARDFVVVFSPRFINEDNPMNRRRKKPNDPNFDRLVKDIVKIIKESDAEMEKIRKRFPNVRNPLRKRTKKRVKE